ncbi:MAG: NosD domain-containing protein [bacterium]|nr:NosD domain-containing protein [bacterium]
MDNFSRNKILTIVFLLSAFFVSGNFLFLTNVNAEEIPDFSPMFEMPGTIESSGTHFEITNSEYLNITLDSSESIKLRMESIPEMITMMIEPMTSSTTATSTQIILSGFAPSTKYYKYQDDYHNLTEFITDENGNYAYFQDLSKPHFVFIQPRKSTKFIKDDATGGDCYLIGNWNGGTKTCTLTKDVFETIQIDNDGITLDGNGHIITGSNTGFGIYLPQKTGVIVKNLSINQFNNGIYLFSSNGNNLINNISNFNGSGIVVNWNSNNNNFINNTTNYNRGFGINISSYSNNNVLSNNTTNNNDLYGIYVYYGNNYNNLSGNIANSNDIGIYLYTSNNNNLADNITNSNRIGIYFFNSSNNKIYNNNFINNRTQISVYWGSGNVFSLVAPIGGNYWSNFDTPTEGCNDLNNDNFCDSPYIFIGGQDNLPWKTQNGWKPNQPPTISNINQYKSDGLTLIFESGITTESTIVFKAVLSDQDNNQVKLQVELKEFNQPFNEQDLSESGFVNSGSEAIINRQSLVDGNYKWRARAVDDKDNKSQWQEFGIAGNVDFVVHMVPLYTQRISDYPSSVDTTRWADLDYANGGIGKYSCAKTERATIAKCGCAITSMVMLGRYYNINSGIDGTDVNPQSINSWLTANKGYLASINPDVNGGLVWGKAIEYLGTIENGVKKTYLALDFYNASSTADSAIINNYLDSAKPVIAYSGRFGHYFVIDNKLTNTYAVKDPYWYKTQTLSDSDNPAQYVRGYNNKFNTANLFGYSAVPQRISAAMYLYLASPAEYLVIDPQGRKLGTDPITGVDYSEIPNASYSLDGPIISSDEPPDQNAFHQVKTLYIPNPLDGSYDVKVIGIGTGSYVITSVIYDNNGSSKTENLYGNTLLNLSTDYNLNFNSISSQNTEFAPADTTPPVISHTDFASQYLLNSAPLQFNFTATDVGVGVFNVTSTLDGISITSGQQITFDKLSSHIISITAQDFVGNTATKTINFNVIYDFSGFLSPIKANVSYKLGRTLPVKFQLKDANGNFISTAIAKLYVAKIQNGIAGADIISFSTSNADNGNQFRYDSTDNQYIYNLSTNNLAIGTWQLKIILDDGKYYTVNILIK